MMTMTTMTMTMRTGKSSLPSASLPSQKLAVRKGRAFGAYRGHPHRGKTVEEARKVPGDRRLGITTSYQAEDENAGLVTRRDVWTKHIAKFYGVGGMVLQALTNNQTLEDSMEPRWHNLSQMNGNPYGQPDFDSVDVIWGRRRTWATFTYH
jgi:hypothetical protein